MNTEKSTKLVVMNDDNHSYEDVIHALQTVCGHNQYQAEQLAYIIDNVGEAEVKVDTDKNKIETMYELLKSEWGLIAEIR